MAAFTDTPRLTNRYADALAFAFSAHNHQIRKQGETPYISHLLAVSGLVLEAGGSEDEAIAGLLHDYIEDIDPENGFDTIADKFGIDVAMIVLNLSAETNKEYIDAITNNQVMKYGSSVIAISFADKLHNLRSYSTDGRHLWKPGHAQFYDQLIPLYEGCNRVPRHWIEEMKEKTSALKVPTAS